MGTTILIGNICPANELSKRWMTFGHLQSITLKEPKGENSNENKKIEERKTGNLRAI